MASGVASACRYNCNSSVSNAIRDETQRTGKLTHAARRYNCNSSVSNAIRDESQRTGKLTHAARRFYGTCSGSALSRLDSASVSFGKLN